VSNFDCKADNLLTKSDCTFPRTLEVMKHLHNDVLKGTPFGLVKDELVLNLHAQLNKLLCKCLEESNL
jgi:hypothetical protein